MAKGLFQKISGREGAVRINSLGVLVGEFKTWSLARHGDGEDRDSIFYDFRAVFSYVNPHLWEAGEYERTVTIKIGKDEFRLEQGEGFPAPVLSERTTLIMQGVRLCQ